MLTPKQKRDLKALASTLTIRYQIGKNEISQTLIDMLDKALTAHELIKIDVMKGCSLPIMEVAIDISNRLNAELCQNHLFHLFTLSFLYSEGLVANLL